MSVTFCHQGTNLVSEEQVRSLELLPRHFKASYAPVPNGVLIDMIKEGADRWIGSEPVKQQFSMNTKGTRTFGTMSFNVGDSDTMLSFGFGNSYDKSMSLRFVAGSQIFICDNLCYSGNSVSWVRKHTINIWRDIKDKIRDALCEAECQYHEMQLDLSALKQRECDLHEGHKLIGLAQGMGFLPDTAANIARKDWNNPRYPEFAPPNLYSLYNCFTEGVKKGEAGKRIDRQAAVHEFFLANS